LTLTWTALFVLSLLLQYFSFAAAAPALAAHDTGLFELDGNAVDSAAPGADWQNGAEGSADQFFAGANTEASANDNTYFTTGGSKDENDVPSWAITGNPVPDKDELTDAYAAVYQSNGETWVYFGADRFDNDGTAQIGFWFFQNKVGIANGDFTGTHHDGDVLILSEYTNGGSVSLICAYEWASAGGGSNLADKGNCDPATSGSHLNLVAAGSECDVADGTFDICAVTNADTATAPWTFTNKSGAHDFATGQFFEGGINLSDMFGGQAPCFGSFLAETRSSAETDAQLKDFAFGSLNTCVPPTIATTSSKTSADFGQTVTDTANLSGANGPVTGTVDFFVCTPAQVTAAGCPSGGTLVTDNAAISNGVATSTAYTIGLTAAAAGKYCWRAEYTPDASSQYLAGSHTNATTECFTVAPATIAITKVANPLGPVNAGDTIGFDVTVTNTGAGTALGVTVNDPLPAGINWAISPASADCSISGAVGSQSLVCGPRTLAAGASFSVHVQGASDAADCGTVTNADAHVTTTNDGDDHASASVVVNCPDLKVEKTPDNGTVQAGQNATFTIVVTNLGPGTATGATLSDNLPAGYTWSVGGADGASCSINTVPSPDVLSCNFGTLASGATRTITLTAPTSGRNCDVIPNTATVAATNEPSNKLTNNSDSGSIDVLCANITIVKDANPVGPVSAGDEIGFDITVTNNGDGIATDVHVSDNLPDGISWTADAPTGSTTGLTCAIVGGDLVCDDASMGAGDSFKVHVHGLTDAADCGTVNNTASVTTGNDGSGSDPASVVVQCPDITVDKTADNSPINAGQDAAFTITVSNAGPGVAKNVHVSDNLPAGVTWTIDPAVAGCSIATGTLTCDFASLGVGAQNAITIHIHGATDAADCGTLPNTVNVSASNEPAANTGNNSDSATVVVNCPDVAVEKTADDADISAGQGASFTIKVTNVGTGTATAVTLHDQLLGSGWSVGGTNGSDCSINASNVLTCNFGDLAQGASRTITVSRPTTFADCGELPNLVTVAATNELEDFLGNNSDNATIVVNCPDLGIVKTPDHADSVLVGDQIGFTVTIQNSGEGIAFNVAVNDPLPAGFTWTIESQSGGWSIVGGALVWGPGSLDPDESATVHIVSPTDSGDCGIVPNAATLLQAGEPVTGEGVNNPATAAETVRCPTLTIDKSAVTAQGETINPVTGLPIVLIGETVTYSLQYSLVDGPVSNGIIKDVLPVGVDYVAGTATNNEEFTFQGYTAATRTLTWSAPAVTASAPPNTALTYDATINASNELLPQPRINVATIDSDQTPPDDDQQPVTVAVPQLNEFQPVAQCDGNVPYLVYDISVSNLPGADSVTITFINPGGADIVFADQPLSGKILWPGAVLDAGGNIVDWPGWTLHPDGTWTQGDAFDWVRPTVQVNFEVNPDVTLTVDYPPESSACANPPPALGIVKDNDAPITTVDTSQGPVDLPTANEGDTVTYTLTYNTNGIPQTNGVVTDVLPAGVTYVDGSASNNDEFTFVSYTAATRTLRWEAPTVTKGGTLTYKATVDEGAAELQQPLINVATIVTDQQPPDSDDSPVFVPAVPLDLTPPPTDALAPSAPASNPGFALMLILLSVAAFALAIGFITPVPEHVRRRDRLG